uniref:Lectin n=1 Tax=Arisaema heterophyllum TaxID=227498 RepID=A0A5B8H5A0_9ARAE|nr:lectin [Arisaema heterophyllum]
MAAAKPGISSYVLPLFVSALFLGFLSLPSAADSVLYSGGSLLTGQSLVQGNYSFVMQEDCNLVLYNGRVPLWASLTYHQGFRCVAILQREGDLMIFSGSGRLLWSSGTGRVDRRSYVLVLQPDGNVVIYGTSIRATGIGGSGPDKVVKGTAKKGALPFTPGVSTAEKGRKAAGSSDVEAGTGSNRA